MQKEGIFLKGKIKGTAKKSKTLQAVWRILKGTTLEAQNQWMPLIRKASLRQKGKLHG